MVFKKYSKILGVSLVSLGLLCSTSYAASVVKTIQVSYNNIKIFVDDKLISPKDGKGEIVEPFIYQGTTYLPVRAVSEALGKEVKWDDNTKSIYIREPGPVDESKVRMDQLEYFDIQHNFTYKEENMSEVDGFKDANENIFSKAIVYELYPSKWIYTDYLINKKYSKIKGKLALSYESREEGINPTYLKIYGDNRLIYTSTAMMAGGLPVDFDVDISGIEKLRIQVSQNFGGSNLATKFGLVDVVLYK